MRNKEILIQFVDSQENILSSSDTILNTENIMFSKARSIVEYKNQQLFVCIDWERYIPLVEGEYVVKIYIDNVYTRSYAEFKLR